MVSFGSTTTRLAVLALLVMAASQFFGADAMAKSPSIQRTYKLRRCPELVLENTQTTSRCNQRLPSPGDIN